MAREVKIAILGDARDFRRAVDSANRDASSLQGHFGKVSGGIMQLGKAAALGAAGLAVGGAALAKGFVDAAIESQKVTAQTNAVIKSMGNAANVTAAQVAKLSTKLSLKAGIDDELIQSGANVLLTFGKIRNEAGKGNDIFDQATQSALDLSIAMKMDMKSASILVGKALNDPIKGLTSLTRAGIQFTDQQKDQIKAMVAAGDTAGAQKVILGELQKQFGGSAAAQATATDRLKVAWGNLQEQLGAKLLPVVEKVASFLADKLPGAMARVGKAITPIAGQISAFWNTLTSGFTEDEGTPIERFALSVREWVPKIVAGFQAVVGFVRQHWPEIQRVITEAIDVIVTVVSGAVDVITTLWDNFGNNILSFVQRVWPNIQQVIGGVLDIIRGIVKTVTALIKGDWSAVWEGIKQVVSGVWSAIQGIVKSALEAVRTSMGIALEVIGSVFKSAWSGMVDYLYSLPGKVGAIASRLWEALKEGLAAAVRWIRQKLDSLLGPLDEIASKAGGIVGKLGGAAGNVLGGLGGLLGRAHGGPVSGGTPYIVGERGPELFMPGRSGTIIPNNRLGGGGGGVTNVINITTGADPQAVVEAIKRYTRSNGPLPANLVA